MRYYVVANEKERITSSGFVLVFPTKEKAEEFIENFDILYPRDKLSVISEEGDLTLFEQINMNSFIEDLNRGI